MLRINLLPIRQLKKRAKAQRQFGAMIALFVLVAALLAGVGYLQLQQIDTLNAEVARLQKEKDSYSPTLKKINKLKKQKQELARRTDIINRLKADSSLTVRVLDEVANRVDNQRMWLTSLKQQGRSLTVAGIALDNQTIAQFMDVMKESPFVTEVTLNNSSLKKVSGKDLKSFALSCSVSHPPKEQPEVADAK